MNIIVLTTSYMESHCYILAEHGRAIVVDPGDFALAAETVRKETLTLDMCIVTHEHCDHIYGCTGVREEFHCKVLARRLCSLNMQDSRKNFFYLRETSARTWRQLFALRQAEVKYIVRRKIYD